MRLLLTRTDADEGMLCAMEVIKAMKGPFAPATVKSAIARLLRPKQPLLAGDKQAELIRVQAPMSCSTHILTKSTKTGKTKCNSPY